MALAQTTAYGDLELDDQLTLADLESVARGGRQVTLSAAARQRVASNREFVERLVEDGSTVYGVSTGFGRFATTLKSLGATSSAMPSMMSPSSTNSHIA